MTTATATATAPAQTRSADSTDDYGVSDTPDWREVDWQQHLRETRIGGRRVNYVDLDEADSAAPPIVFVHGLAGCWQVWLENIAHFAQQRRVVALDLPGFGYSEMPADELSMSGYGRVVDALCDGLDLGAIVLVGNSMGGFVSAETAIQFPQRVDRLVLNSSVGFDIHNRKGYEMATWARVSGAFLRWQASRLEEVVARPRLRHLFFRDMVYRPEKLAPDLCVEITKGCGRPGFADAVKAFHGYDLRERFSEIEVPTLIVWGRKDRLVPARDADEFERCIDGSTKLVLEQTGHYAMVERPRRFNSAVRDFIGT